MLLESFAGLPGTSRLRTLLHHLTLTRCRYPPDLLLLLRRLPSARKKPGRCIAGNQSQDQEDAQNF